MTKIILKDQDCVIRNRQDLRNLSKEDFIQLYGSGTLRKSYKIGFNIDEAYLKERVKFEFGYGFEVIQRSRITYSDVELKSHHSVTEFGWHLERMIEIRPFQSDEFLAKKIHLEYEDGIKKSGLAIIVNQTSASWIPKGYFVFALLVDDKNQNCLNPF